jgi:hypothetical protein
MRGRAPNRRQEARRRAVSRPFASAVPFTWRSSARTGRATRQMSSGRESGRRCLQFVQRTSRHAARARVKIRSRRIAIGGGSNADRLCSGLEENSALVSETARGLSTQWTLHDVRCKSPSALPAPFRTGGHDSGGRGRTCGGSGVLRAGAARRRTESVAQALGRVDETIVADRGRPGAADKAVEQTGTAGGPSAVSRTCLLHIVPDLEQHLIVR